MSARVTLLARVEQYLAERRNLGFKLNNMGHRLASFARYVANASHEGPLTVDLMADWARQAKAGRGDRATLARRLKMLRPFTTWLRQFDPATEVPDEAVFGRVPGRMTPHVYREPEIVELLAAAKQLGPKGGLRPAVMETLFGLVACTGLRISEALGLLDADVDLRASVLTIRQSKFGKTRLVPLHPSAVEALAHYRTLRSRHVRATSELPFFVASRGQLLGQAVGDRQVHRVFCDLRRQLGWVDRGSHGTPRIHDLHHYSESREMPSSVGVAFEAGAVEGSPREMNSAYSGALQSLEESHQLVVGLEPSHAALVWFDLVESSLLDVEVCIEIDLRCLYRLVTQPQRDHAAIRARLQQLHGHRVSQHVRRYMLVAQRRAALAGSIYVLGQQVLHAICAQAASARAGEDDRVFGACDLAQPCSQDVGSGSGQRRRSLLAPLAEDPDMRAGSKAHSTATQPGDLRQAQPGLDGQEHERVVAPTRQGAQVRGAQEGIDLLTREKPDLRLAAALAGNGQHSLNLCRVVWHLEGRVPKERANGSQAQVAAAGTDAATVLQVLQERGDQRGIDLFELQVLRRDAKALPREAQELPKAVAVRSNRMGTDLPLLHQPTGEEALQQCGKAGRGHDRSSQRRSTRAIASAMSCG